MLSTNLSLKEGVEFGKHLIVILRLKRIFKGRQAIPRYVSIYYADIVIEFLKSLPTWDEISAVWKVPVFGVILVRIFPYSDWIRTIITPNADTFYAVRVKMPGIKNGSIISFIVKSQLSISFLKKLLFIHQKLSFQSKPITVKVFPSDERICSVRTIVEFMKRTEQFRKTNKLFRLLWTWTYNHTNIMRICKNRIKGSWY